MYLNKKLNPLIIGATLLALNMALLSSGCTDQVVPDSEPEPGEKVTEGSITLAATTSTYDSGLLDYLNQVFTEKTGIAVEVVSQGSSAALNMGRRGDTDVLLVHDRESELDLVEKGYFVDRYDVMYNDFIFVGAKDDPAGLQDISDPTSGLTLIAESESTFVSRGDDSGTHRVEEHLWAGAGINPEGQDWYFSIGQGMGSTLNMANEKQTYTMTDRGTFVSMRDNLDLQIVLEGDPTLVNQYGVMAVNPEEHNHVKYDLVTRYIEFMMSEDGQELIYSYQVNNETLFFPGNGLE